MKFAECKNSFRKAAVLEEKRWKFQLEPAGSGTTWQDVPQFLWQGLSKFCEDEAPKTITLPTSFIVERPGHHPNFDVLGQQSRKVWSVLENHAQTPGRTVILQLVDVKLQRLSMFLHVRWFLDSDVAPWEAGPFVLFGEWGVEDDHGTGTCDIVTLDQWWS